MNWSIWVVDCGSGEHAGQGAQDSRDQASGVEAGGELFRIQ
ncbi:hypothetical protein [Streptomyces sp. NPDC001530]